MEKNVEVSIQITTVPSDLIPACGDTRMVR